MEFARGPTFLELYGELPPRLGCNPKRSTTVHQIGTFLNSPFHSTFYTHCTAGRCCSYCASWPAELCYTSGLAIWRHTGWVTTAQLPGGHRWCHTEVPAGWPSESTQYPGLNAVHRECPLLVFAVEAAIQDALGDKAIRAPCSAGFSTGIALKKQWVHGNGLW